MVAKPATARNPAQTIAARKPVKASAAKRSPGPDAAEQAEVKALLEKINRTLDETEAILASTVR